MNRRPPRWGTGLLLAVCTLPSPRVPASQATPSGPLNSESQNRTELRRTLPLEGETLLDRLDYDVWTTEDGLPQNSVTSIVQTRDGYRDGGSIHYTAADGLPRGKIRSIHDARDGNLWIATYGTGLARLSDGKFTRYTTRDGLFDNSLGKILEDDDGNLWINSNQGVFRVSLGELNAFAEGRIPMINRRALRTGEGNGGSGSRTPDGRLWFPTIDGLVMIEPENATINDVPPPVVIERLWIGGNALGLSDRIEAPLGERDITVAYAGLCFTDPEHVRFKHRLVGHDGDWVEAGTRRIAPYANIPPGKYEFQVVACNRDGVWSETAATLPIGIVPYFYETRWFLAGSVLALTAMAFVGYRVRTHGIRTRAALLQAQINERKRAEEVLRSSEEKYRTLVTHLPQRIFYKDGDSVYVSCNDNYAKDLGIKPEEIIGKTDYEFYSRELAEKYRADDARIMVSGATEEIEEGYVHNGQELLMQTVKTPVKNENGDVIGVLGIFWDITVRKRAQEALRESKEFLQTVIDAAPDPMLVIGRDYRIVLANRALQMFAGQDPVAGRMTCHQATHHSHTPCAEPACRCPLKEVIAAKVPVYVEHTHYDGEDNARTVALVAAPIFDSAGDVVQIVESCGDITERKRIEERARQHQAELARVSRLSTIGEMTAGIAHGLNQPLFAVLTYAEACRLAISSGRRAPNEVLSDLERISAAAAEAGEVVRRLRNFVRKREPSRSTVDLNKLIQGAVPLIENDLTRNDIRLRLELGPRIPTVLADSLLLQQVVLNLTRNAIEAMKCHDDGERGLLIQTSVPESDIVEVAVCDTGPGLAAEHVDRLFDPFFTTKSHGLGLGLSLSRSLIEAEGGHLMAERNPDHGMTFRFTLPVCAGDPDDGV